MKQEACHAQPLDPLSLSLPPEVLMKLISKMVEDPLEIFGWACLGHGRTQKWLGLAYWSIRSLISDINTKLMINARLSKYYDH